MSDVTIELDSSEVVNFCNERPPPKHSQQHIVEETRRIAARTNSTITYIYRLPNQTTDCLARLGSQQDEDLIVLSSIPFAAREFALAAAMSVGHLRT
ncbi:hypothetical protein RHMOL_Rhmol01G0043800 [Rhododendron molle]|uniref:Uncharacterized protein n=1 Tax=Rhododendron molle TaxID=49168 RepID=A0ACC0PZG1_RHOML|nr:hypothetical protein RHMOL_Rhmol01G0043800 [Rhododendron molle]